MTFDTWVLMGFLEICLSHTQAISSLDLPPTHASRLCIPSTFYPTGICSSMPSNKQVFTTTQLF